LDIGFQKMKIIDLGWPWRSVTISTVGYPSDYRASCCFMALAAAEVTCVNALFTSLNSHNIVLVYLTFLLLARYGHNLITFLVHSWLSLFALSFSYS